MNTGAVQSHLAHIDYPFTLRLLSRLGEFKLASTMTLVSSVQQFGDSHSIVLRLSRTSFPSYFEVTGAWYVNIFVTPQRVTVTGLPNHFRWRRWPFRTASSQISFRRKNKPDFLIIDRVVEHIGPEAAKQGFHRPQRTVKPRRLVHCQI
jgi:hypothetical protein